MNLENAVDEFRKGTLKLDFTKMRVAQCGGAGEIIEGGGCVYQGADGRLELKCYGKAVGEHDRSAVLQLAFGGVPGKLYEHSDHYDVEAVDVGGETWTVPPTLVTRNWSTPQDAGSISADGITLIRSRKLKSAKPKLTLVFLEQDMREWRALLCDRHEVRLQKVGLRFQMSIASDRPAQVILQIEADADLPTSLTSRIVEALQFVLARTMPVALQWNIREDTETTKLHSASARTPSAPAYSPIETHRDDLHSKALDMLTRYLDYVMSWPEEGVWHPCTNFLTLARNASHLSLDAWIVGLSVAIEGVASQINYAHPEELAAKHAAARAAIKAPLRDLDERVRNRIGGMVSQLDTVRARDRMESLASSNMLLSSDIKDWQNLRNRAVHTRTAKASDFETTKLQGELAAAFRALRLLHSIVFHLIEYRGPFTDYGRRGFPDASYPFRSESEAAPTS